MASKSQDEVAADVFTCVICQVAEPGASRSGHENGLLHQAVTRIAAAALDRLRDNLLPKTTVSAGQQDTEESINSDPMVSFCGSCAATFETSDRHRHERTKTHLMSALDDQVFDELVRWYLDEEDLALMVAPASDLSDDDVLESSFRKSQAVDMYKCHICALEIPIAFKEEHELSSRHNACKAIAYTASRRTSAYLRRSQPDNTKTNKSKNKMVELLKAYTGEDLAKKDLIEDTEETTEEAKEEVVTGKRLTTKKYFKDILPFMKYAGAFYTIIVDDTDFVTVKVGDTYLRVHVTNFNGVYSIGESKDYKLICRMCDGNLHNYGISYNSAGQQDKLHVMSLGHIKRLLSPIDNIHGIRKIDTANSLCVLCNHYMPAFAVEEHIMKDIQHTYFLNEALEQGKSFKESADDLKIILYAARLDKSGLFMRNPPNNFNSVLPHHGALFGGAFPQNASNFNGNSSNHGTLFGSSNNNFPQDYSKGSGRLFGSSVQGFGNSNTASLSGKVASTQSTSKPFEGNSIFGSTQPDGDNTTAFGSAQTFGGGNNNTIFGSAQSAGNNSATFGSAQPSVNNSTAFGSAQSFGGNSTIFGSAPPAGNNSTTFGSAQTFGAKNTIFGSAQPAGNNSTTFGSAQPSSSNNAFGTGLSFGGYNGTVKKSDDFGNSGPFGSGGTPFGNDNPSGTKDETAVNQLH